MKELFIGEITKGGEIDSGTGIELYGWISRKRVHKNTIFLDMADSTGTIQVVVDRMKVGEPLFEEMRGLLPESAIKVEGSVFYGPSTELRADSIHVVAAAKKRISPNPRGGIDIFNPHLTSQLLRNRHLYIRNEKTMALLKFRHLVMGIVHKWFRDQGFVEITAPVLTPLPLYDDGTAIAVQVGDESVFLTQCVGFYLESAVHAFERVYNIGPSFRGEESRSKRHLMEYWHIKAEAAFADIEDMIGLVENLIQEITRECVQGEEYRKIQATLGTNICTDGALAPFPRITYREAVARINKAGFVFPFGKSLGSKEEALLASSFDSPFWIQGIPRSIEPFPYVIDGDDPEVTRTADLIASKGYGELLGVAEKITSKEMLDTRMEEKGKLHDQRYDWLLELRDFGCVPHGGFGMGVERLLRWLLQVPHVRDVISFPRSFRRKIYP